MTFRAPLVTRWGSRLVSSPKGPFSVEVSMAPSGLRAVCLIVPLLGLVSPAHAQLIPVKTIPIAQGDQFQIFPTNNLGMRSVSIALADSLSAPVVNPAMGTRVAGARFFSSPPLYSVSRNAGGGRSLPFAVLARRAAWYRGLALAVQQVDASRPPQPHGRFVLGVPEPNAIRPVALDTSPNPGPDRPAR